MLPLALLEKLGFDGAQVISLHTGISETFSLCTRTGEKLVVKTLREERPGEYSPYGEMAWLSELSAKSVPCVRPYFSDNWQQNIIKVEDRIFKLYAYVEGIEPDIAVEKHYISYGRILRNLHDVADQILVASDDIKRQRPLYDTDFLIGQFYPEIDASPLFDKESKKTLFNLADVILDNFPQDRGFVHGDFHVGNMLMKDSNTTILDFDECGFGSRYYDIGTMLLHTLAKNNRAGWQGFLKGYGLDGHEKNIAYGAASRIFYMIGALPRRIDIIAGLKDDASYIIQRYTGFIETIIANKAFNP